jgi:anaerobic selenocysteine-containing dehydrogenase
MADHASTQKIHGHCALCIARCGTIATVEGGRFVRLDPDPSHPTGQAICAKGRAAPELVYHPERLTRPLRRTRPKGDADPGWVPISWDEALDLTVYSLAALYILGPALLKSLPERAAHLARPVAEVASRPSPWPCPRTG